MATCDICGKNEKGTFISSEDMRKAVFKNGFNPYASGLIKSHQMHGIKDEEIYKGWKRDIVAQDQSDWNICSECMSTLEPYLEGSFRPSGIHSSDVRLFSKKGVSAEKEAEKKYGGEKTNTNWIAKLTEYLKQLGINANFIPSSSNPNFYGAKILHLGINLVVRSDNKTFMVSANIGKVPKQNLIKLLTKLLTYNSILPGVYFSINKFQQIQVNGGRHLEGLDVHELKIFLDYIVRFITKFAIPIVKEYNLKGDMNRKQKESAPIVKQEKIEQQENEGAPPVCAKCHNSLTWEESYVTQETPGSTPFHPPGTGDTRPRLFCPHCGALVVDWHITKDRDFDEWIWYGNNEAVNRKASLPPDPYSPGVGKGIPFELKPSFSTPVLDITKMKAWEKKKVEKEKIRED